MKFYSYTLVAQTPVSAGKSGERSNVRHAHTVIPGGTVRGALAASWWKTTPPGTAADFAELFDRDLLVGQAVPTDLELISASARACKYRSLESCADVLQERGLPDRANTWDTCWECGGPLTPISGWRRMPKERSSALVSRTRGALTDREQAAHGQLFTRQAVVGTGDDAAATFAGVIRAPERWTHWLDHLQIRVGGGRSLDYGRAQLTIAPQSWPPLRGGGRCLLRLTSPAILLDEFGGPDVSIAGWQSEIRRVTGDQVTLSAEAAWLRTESVSGWHMRSRLPKAHDWALAAGSVAVLEGLSAPGWQRLQSGIGVRTLEGYGQVEIVDPDSILEDPANQGHERLAAVRQKVAKPKRWAALSRELTSTLQEMLDADEEELKRLRKTTFHDLSGEERTLVGRVLAVPPGHIPGTIDKLKGIR